MRLNINGRPAPSALGVGLCTVLLALLAPASEVARAESPPDSRAYKIGVVDSKEVFKAYEKAKEEYADLEKQVTERQKSVDQLQADIKKKQERYEAQRDTMTEEEREELQIEIESGLRHWRTELARQQEDIDKMEERALRKLLRDVTRAAAEVAARDNYHLVLDADAKSGVLYFSPTINMTQKVIDYINSDAWVAKDEG